MCLVGSDSKVKPVAARQIVAIKRMWFFTFREELDVSGGLTQSDVRELVLKIYNYEESRCGKYYDSIGPI
ncbi:hypothetical protein CDB3_21720 [Bacillus sp. CDB3]|nr:hypothetical protein CDB3_21720 [Bacillus sp. CDB3]